MNILSIPYITGGLSHFIPFFVLHQKYIKNIFNVRNHFLVNEGIHNFLKIYKISCVPLNYTFAEIRFSDEEIAETNKYVLESEKKAFDMVNPSIIIEDFSFLTPLIAEKNNIPRISIQRTGVFRSIDKLSRNLNHIHSLQKGEFIRKSDYILRETQTSVFNDCDTFFLNDYLNSKAKIIPGIATIERLPDNVENRESYFYSGPLLIMDKPSQNLLESLCPFLSLNNQKPIVFVTTGTVDRTPIENFIEFFIKRNYAVITTCDCMINEVYKQEVFYSKFLPLNYICSISSLVVHHCGSGMYHYPIMHGVPTLTIGTQCYDREDIALRLQELGVSGHIPHPEDNSNYWRIFIEFVEKFENNKLVNFKSIEKLKSEIEQTMSGFKMEKVIEYALS